MLAMQYSFTLPADYDMGIIRRRIADKGHLLDDFPGLAFKAYLSAERQSVELPSRDNLYAPFYVWNDNQGMNAFLEGPGFTGLTQSFGWPSVRTWSVWQAETAADLTAAICAVREIVTLSPYSDLDERRRTETQASHDAMAAGALAAVSAFEPTDWTLVRFRLWPGQPAIQTGDGGQLYRVGHVSQPGITS